MCGITGWYSFNDNNINYDILKKMNDSLYHRGPNYGEVKTYKSVGLGHRRLSIIDLSSNANQPMTTNDKNYTIIYNGEIYNFVDIKNKLRAIGFRFSTNSDTEVVLKAFEAYGESCFKMFNGMFAIAIYDAKKDKLIISRDQYGIKPLYFYKDSDKLLFASEIKAIKLFPNINLTLNNQSLSEFIWYGNSLGNRTIYKEILQIEPGTYLSVSKKDFTSTKYFDINKTPQLKKTEKEATNEIKVLLEDAIKRHLVSDVQVGVLLSGGIDSSAITAFASKHYKGKLNTYSIAFDFEKGVNELALARKVAEKFKTNHHEIKITGSDLVNVLEKLAESHDQPFADAANIPLYLITGKLNNEVKVLLQGDGGDEFFGGYSRYNTLSKLNKWKILAKFFKPFNFIKFNSTKILRLQRFLEAISTKEPYLRNALLLTMESKFSNPSQVLNENFKQNIENCDPFLDYKEKYKSYNTDLSDTQSLFYTDTQIILKNTFLEKVDKSTMANSIEVRVPFLDKDLTTYLLGLDSQLKIKNGVQKYLLKKVLDGIIPDEILYGKKKGFGVPYGYWLKTSLKEYFLEQINTESVKNIIDYRNVIKMFEKHVNNKNNYDFLLWKVLMLAIWINKNNYTSFKALGR